MSKWGRNASRKYQEKICSFTLGLKLVKSASKIPAAEFAIKHSTTDPRSNIVTNRYFKVKQRDIVYIKFILEAYEGMNIMSTVDNTAGIIRIVIMDGFENDMDALLAELGKQVEMEPVEWTDAV